MIKNLHLTKLTQERLGFKEQNVHLEKRAHENSNWDFALGSSMTTFATSRTARISIFATIVIAQNMGILRAQKLKIFIFFLWELINIKASPYLD